MHGIFAPLIAIYNQDNTVLDGLKVPKKAELPKDIEYIDPIPELSDSTLKNQLLFSLGELCPVYTDPDVLKQMIKLFNDVYHSNFLTLWQTTLYKFNPIWNKDGTYTETRKLTSGKTNSEQSSGSSSEQLTTGNSETFSGTTGMTKTGSITESRSYQDTVLHNVTGFDTNSLSPAYNDETNGVDGGTTASNETDSGTSGSTTTGSGTGSKTGSTSGSKSGAEDLSESETWTKRETGNIGVTTTQQMIREQREIVTFNMYTYIIELFKKELMVQVY